MKAPQPSLFERHNAAHAAALAAGPTWRSRALEEVRSFLRALRQDDFIAEEVVSHAFLGGELEDPPDARAWGSVILEAKRLGLIQSTGRFRLDRTGAPKTVWRKA